MSVLIASRVRWAGRRGRPGKSVSAAAAPCPQGYRVPTPMGVKVVKFEPTPNPNAVKCLLDGPLPGGAGVLRSFLSVREAVDDPLASALFAIEGVTTLLISERWITVNKASDADFEPIKRQVRAVLAGVSVP